MTSHFEPDLDAPAESPPTTLPVLSPRLPAPAVKAAPPAGAGFVPPMKFVPVTPPPSRSAQRRRRPFAWVLVLVLVVAGAAVYVLKVRSSDTSEDTSSTENSTDVSTAPADPAGGLPDLHFDRPALTSATWSESLSNLELDDDGVAQVVTTSIQAKEDYTQSIARFDLTILGTDKSATAMTTPEYTYQPSDVFGAPWTRTRRDASSPVVAMDAPSYLDVYQDIVNAKVRADAKDVVTSTSAIDGVPVTTYEFDVDATDLGGDEVQDLPVTFDPALMIGHVELAIDETGLVRHWSLTMDEALLRGQLIGDVTSLPLSFGRDIISVNQPVDVALPTDYVDQLSQSCQTDKNTLETATEAWFAQTGSVTPPTESQLVTDGMLRKQSDTYDLVDGTAVAVAGGSCDVPT